MTPEMLQMAIRDYFRGERQEMLTILAGALLLTLVAAALYAILRDGFAKGFTVVVVLAALLLTGTAASLLRRDRQLEARLQAEVRSASATEAVRTEAERVAEIVRKYPYYRYAALALGLTALAAVATTRHGWIDGAAAGLLLLIVAQLTIDHYSERRATRYAAQLHAAQPPRP